MSLGRSHVACARGRSCELARRIRGGGRRKTRGKGRCGGGWVGGLRERHTRIMRREQDGWGRGGVVVRQGVDGPDGPCLARWEREKDETPGHSGQRTRSASAFLLAPPAVSCPDRASGAFIPAWHFGLARQRCRQPSLALPACPFFLALHCPLAFPSMDTASALARMRFEGGMGGGLPQRWPLPRPYPPL